MSDEGRADRLGPDERAWREVVERTVRSDDGCCERVDGLRTGRAEFDGAEPTDASRSRIPVGALILLAIPVILYSEFVAPSAGINYATMGTGLLLMIAATLAHL